MEIKEAVVLGLYGMSIVLVALTLISIFVKILGNMAARYQRGELNFIQKFSKSSSTSLDDIKLENDRREQEIAVAIAVALATCLQTEQFEIAIDYQLEDGGVNPWAMAGRLNLIERMKR